MPHRIRRTLVLLAAASVACGGRIDDRDGAGPGASTVVEPSSDAGVGTGGAPSGGAGRNGQSGSGAEPAGAGASGKPSGPKHADCTAPFPSPPPALPDVPTDGTGRPLFDKWRDIECSAAGQLCEAKTFAPYCSLCFLGEPGATIGVCATMDIDTSCDGEGQVIGFNHGQCWMCAPLEAHARACCEQLPGFDCRAWPYPSDGKLRMVCARHEDCEPGLVCGSGGDPARGYPAKGYGICQCPGAAISIDTDCDFAW